MITIEYVERGVAISDFDIGKAVDSFCSIHKKTKEDAIYYIANDKIIDAMKLKVLEGEISHEDLQFKFNGEIIKVYNKGEIEKYPDGFCDHTTKMLFKMNKLRREIKKMEDITKNEN